MSSTYLDPSRHPIDVIIVDEYRELEALDKLGNPQPAGPYRQARGRTPQQQARYETLTSSSRGATGATPTRTAQLRSRFDTYQDAHHPTG
ncbi:hypothetical protein ACLQ24_26935 [Micromonospora sp. DT4]|uniref:hypothetical protein n=1 Tax=Micromonospora sp. DT4 TaxID=3393438 RepID=UPI003CF76F3B